MKNENITIGLDIALNKTGLAILNDKERVLETKLIKVPSGWEYYRKISYLYQEYSSIFNEVLTEEPASSILVLEGRLRAGWSGTTLASIEGARVSAYLAYDSICKLHEKDVKVESYDPNEVKYFIAGKRSAKKEEMLEKSLTQFSWLKGVEYQEDIYDAIYLALRHIKGEKNEPNHKHKRKATNPS